MGRVWKFGDNVNTDEIMPGRYNVTGDSGSLAQYAFCEVRPEFSGTVQPGDVVVAAGNFGCGSSREHAPLALKLAGVQAVVARSFGRIFYRNAINIGLPVLVCPDLHEGVEDGDEVDLDIARGTIIPRASRRTFQAVPPPAFVMEIQKAGSIIAYIKQHGWEISRPPAASP